MAQVIPILFGIVTIWLIFCYAHILWLAHIGPLLWMLMEELFTDWLQRVACLCRDGVVGLA